MPKLREYLIEQEIVASISVEHLRRLLRERKVRWRRTKTWKESNDPDFHRKYRATYNRHLGVRHFLAYYDLKTDRLYGYVIQRKKTPDFLRFMRWVRRRYPMRQRLHVVLDNYGPHLSADLRDWARRNNVRFYFTPTNASWLNRIECHFGPLRKFALNNSDYRTHQQQEAAIETYLRWRNRRRGIGLQSPPKTRKRAA